MSEGAKNYTAIIPAGGMIVPLSSQSGPVLKALSCIGNLSLIEIVLKALYPVGSVSRRIVVGPSSLCELTSSLGAEWVEGTGTLFGNVQAGVSHARLSLNDPVIVIAADLAAPRPESISRFIASTPEDAGMAIPLVSRAEFMKAYPGSLSSFVTLRDGSFTIGSQVIVNAGLILNPPECVARVLGNRKSQFQMAKTLGMGVIFGLITKTITVAALENRISKLIGVNACAVRNCGPDLALDIDDQADLDYASSLIS